jgi:hypothetical protein
MTNTSYRAFTDAAGGTGNDVRMCEMWGLTFRPEG